MESLPLENKLTMYIMNCPTFDHSSVMIDNKIVYRIAGFCHEDFNVASHGICNIKIRYIFYLVTLSREIL